MEKTKKKKKKNKNKTNNKAVKQTEKQITQMKTIN